MLTELVLASTKLGILTSETVLNGGLLGNGEGEASFQEVLGRALFLLTFGYIGMKFLTGAYTNKEN